MYSCRIGESDELNWNMSFKIILGICRGLRFLHGLQRPIIHMDLKPSNILLDDNLMPKIADFGLSRIFGEEQTAKRCASLRINSLG